MGLGMEMEWNVWSVNSRRMKRNASYMCLYLFLYLRMYVCTYCALMAIKSSSQVAFGVYRLTVTKKYSWFL